MDKEIRWALALCGFCAVMAWLYPGPMWKWPWWAACIGIGGIACVIFWPFIDKLDQLDRKISAVVEYQNRERDRLREYVDRLEGRISKLEQFSRKHRAAAVGEEE